MNNSVVMNVFYNGKFVGDYDLVPQWGDSYMIKKCKDIFVPESINFNDVEGRVEGRTVFLYDSTDLSEVKNLNKEKLLVFTYKVYFDGKYQGPIQFIKLDKKQILEEAKRTYILDTCISNDLNEFDGSVNEVEKKVWIWPAPKLNNLSLDEPAPHIEIKTVNTVKKETVKIITSKISKKFKQYVTYE